jgi:hypothetical protein
MKEMNLPKITGVLATAAMIASGSALAVERPDWTFIQAAYGIGDSSTIDIGGTQTTTDTNLWEIAGSLGFADMWHVAADYQDGEYSDTDFDSYTLYVGMNPNVGDGTDLFFDVYYGNLDVGNSGSTSSDQDLWGLQAGVRHMITERFEGNIKVHYSDVDAPQGSSISGSDDVGVEVGGQFNWGSFSSGLSADVTDETIVKLNVRWSFDWL